MRKRTLPNVAAAATVAGALMSFGVAVAATTGSTSSTTPHSGLYTSTSPVGRADADTAAVTLGVKFKSTLSGSVDSIEFYRGSASNTARTVSLWSSSGSKLATATAPSSTALGWVSASFATPFKVTAGTTYVASYFAPAGRYNAINNGFASSRSVGPLTAPASAGVYRYGTTEGFPTQSFQSSEYLVSPLFVSGGATTASPTGTTTSSTATSSASTTPPTTTPISTTPAPVGQLCTSPYFTTSDVNGGVTDGGFYVHNNLWNAANYAGTRGTTAVCSYRSWNHYGTASNASGDGGVKTYPNVHKDYASKALSSFPRLSSSEAVTSPGVGIYNVAYDLWINGIGGSNSNEVMIWTENHDQRPAGNIVVRGISFSGYTWDLWSANNNHYLAFTASAATSGAHPGWPTNQNRSGATLDIKAMLDYLVSAGRVPASSVMNQVGFGVEIVDTGGVQRKWSFTNFSLVDA